MPSISRRSISTLLPALIAAAAIALSPAAAAASTQKVTMNDGHAFSPSSIKVTLGDAVKWKSNANIEKHDVNATKPYALFSSGGAGSIKPGKSFTYTFGSAGTYSYVCNAHISDGMKGTVTVPMKVSHISGSSKLKITVGTSALASSVPWVRVVEMDAPGSPSSYSVIKTTRSGSFKYKPANHGTYRFRSYVKSTGSNGQSQTSPVFSIST